jgi:putative glutamine amidotransferase
MKPLIGINLEIEGEKPRKVTIQCHYVDAIQRAGGIPVLLPPMPNEDLQVVLHKLHGIMLIGGRDYSPGSYQESACAHVELCDESREDFDFRLIQAAIEETELPILGICAGLQLINIKLGGSLIQDIPSEKPESKVVHTSDDGWNKGFTQHAVHIEPKTILSSIYAERQVTVPTSHHQAIKALGRGLRPTAYADDGIIEAVEFEGRPFTIGVQWHPERDFEGNRALFETFVKHAAQSN